MTSSSRNVVHPMIPKPAAAAPPAPPAPVVYKTAQNLYGYIIIATGCFMSIIAGFINVATIMSVFKNPVSHVTGSTSKIAMYLVIQQSALKDVTGPMVQTILNVVFFLLGSFVTGILIRAATFKLGKFFGVLMIIQSLLLFFATVLFAGTHGSWVGAQYFAATACGLQNGMATRFSGAVVRTTHMSGIVTDIGLLLGNWVRWGDTTNLWRLKILVPLYFAFLGGGCAGTVAFLKYDTNCLFIPAALTLVVGVMFFSWGVAYGENGWLIDVTDKVVSVMKRSASVVLSVAGIKPSSAADATTALEVRADAATAAANLSAVAATGAAAVTAAAAASVPSSSTIAEDAAPPPLPSSSSSSVVIPMGDSVAPARARSD